MKPLQQVSCRKMIWQGHWLRLQASACLQALDKNIWMDIFRRLLQQASCTQMQSGKLALMHFMAQMVHPATCGPEATRQAVCILGMMKFYHIFLRSTMLHSISRLNCPPNAGRCKPKSREKIHWINRDGDSERKCSQTETQGWICCPFIGSQTCACRKFWKVCL